MMTLSCRAPKTPVTTPATLRLRPRPGSGRDMPGECVPRVGMAVEGNRIRTVDHCHVGEGTDFSKVVGEFIEIVVAVPPEWYDILHIRAHAASRNVLRPSFQFSRR